MRLDGRCTSWSDEPPRTEAFRPSKRTDGKTEGRRKGWTYLSSRPRQHPIPSIRLRHSFISVIVWRSKEGVIIGPAGESRRVEKGRTKKKERKNALICAVTASPESPASSTNTVVFPSLDKCAARLSPGIYLPGTSFTSRHGCSSLWNNQIPLFFFIKVSNNEYWILNIVGLALGLQSVTFTASRNEVHAYIKAVQVIGSWKERYEADSARWLLQSHSLIRVPCQCTKFNVIAHTTS